MVGTVESVERPSGDIEGCRSAHRRLAALVEDVADVVVRQPSLLPGWTRAHVLTHLARNAEAMCRRLDGALHGEVVEQYVGGAAGRAAEIQSGASRPANEIVDDLVAWANQLDEAFSTLADGAWSKPVQTVRGDEHPVALLPFRRWREVEVHMVDLGLVVTHADWPSAFVDRALPTLLDQLPERSDPRELMAWLLGRGDAPSLPPWG